MSEELTLNKKMGTFTQKIGIQGVRQQAKDLMKGVEADKCPNRYSIGFDDSGSMGGDAIENAKKAVTNFLGSCNPSETSVAIYPFCEKPQPLTIDYTLINMYVGSLKATGGTPLFGTMVQMMKETNLTRGVLFSDGSPTDSNYISEAGNLETSRETMEEVAMRMALELKISFDTVYIGEGDSDVLRKIAEKTGGIYLKFDSTTSFAKNLKYLAPRYIGLLANPEIKARIEKGESI